MKKILVVLCLLSILLVGCDDVREEQVAYNISMRNVTIEKVEFKSVYRGPIYRNIICNVNDKTITYEAETDQLFYSIERLTKTYAISNPGKKIKVDMIYDSSISRVIAVALANEKQ